MIVLWLVGKLKPSGSLLVAASSELPRRSKLLSTTARTRRRDNGSGGGIARKREREREDCQPVAAVAVAAAAASPAALRAAIWKREKEAKMAAKAARMRHLRRAFAGIDKSSI